MPSSTLTQQQAESLQQRAIEAARNAYAPYSRFHVGAAVLLSDSTIVTGCNVENASYRLTTCAEQNAITSAVAQHGPSISIVAIAVANLNSAASQPCGACRQTILEFSAPETIIYFPNVDGSFAQATIAELLPAAFSLNK
ncbi:cytidine deaminase [Edaphobacter acidisoli]|uniref:Cytidine deaminase n=1 Tax=Edaphobacter acidisoli TaxID=2040573 RepID=A0A916RKF0_9BACT|nr:cytidine deaminase [Edaphobacter acidisoli]GGA58604.1 cytidine deaminase [Edaphobacter acidisoli]